MKKSFMTRVLATGLSFAMAFSMAAATNVSVASAASTPAMASKQFAVRVGGAAKSYKASAATQKSYKISKATVGNTSKATVKVNSTKKSIKVTPGTVTGSTVVKIYFKNIKTKKVTSKKYRCVVKPAAVEKLTMEATATHVNQIDLTFNKAIASDAKITLKKGTSTVSATPTVADDAKSAVIKLTGKLTEGVYTVTVVSGEDTLTAEIKAENEKLASFKLGSTLKQTVAATSVNSGASAEISYEALNQYGDKINYAANKQSVTVSMGTVDDVTACKTSAAGTIKVKDIPSLYAIPGQSFTFVIVDTVENTGAMINTTAVYGASATPTQFTCAGVYNNAKATFADLKENDKISDFSILFTVKDQYDDGMDAAEVAKAASNGGIQVVIAGGLTNVAKVSLADPNNTGLAVKEIKDDKYFAVPLTGSAIASDSKYAKAEAGEYTVAITNSTKGMVFNEKFTVTNNATIASISVSAKDVIYAEQDNELEYSVVDSDGKEVTDYATLNGIEFKNQSTGDQYTWVKNPNGTAKLIYHPAAVAYDASFKKLKSSDMRSVTIQANKAISGKLLVQAKTFTVNYKRVARAVTGISSSATTACISGKSITVNLHDLTILDQYSNPFSVDELKAGAVSAAAVIVTGASITTSAAGDATVVTGAQVGSGCAVQDSISSASIAVKKGITFNNAKKIVIENMYTGTTLKLTFTIDEDVAAGFDVDADSAPAKTVAFTCGNAAAISNIKVTVNGGKFVEAGAPLVESSNKWATGYGYCDVATGYPVCVEASMGGQNIVLPVTQWSIVGEVNNYVSTEVLPFYHNTNTETKKDVTINVVVDTADGAVTVPATFTISNLPAGKADSVSVNSNNTASLTGQRYYDAGDVDDLFTVKDQFGNPLSDQALIDFAVSKVVLSASAGSSNYVSVAGKKYYNGDVLPASCISVSQPGTTSAKMTCNIDGSDKAGTVSSVTVTVKVTATVNGTTVERTETATIDIS